MSRGHKPLGRHQQANRLSEPSPGPAGRNNRHNISNNRRPRANQLQGEPVEEPTLAVGAASALHQEETEEAEVAEETTRTGEEEAAEAPTEAAEASTEASTARLPEDLIEGDRMVRMIQTTQTTIPTTILMATANTAMADLKDRKEAKGTAPRIAL